MRNIFLQKSSWKWAQGTSFRILSLQKIKANGWNYRPQSLKLDQKETQAQVFSCESHTFFFKNLIYRTRLLLLIPPFQPRFYHTFMITLFSSFPSRFSSYLVRGFQPPTPLLFKALTPWPSLPPSLKPLFALLSFLFHSLLRYFRQFPPPSHNSLLS